MPDINAPRFLEAPVSVWVRCEDARELSELEMACLVSAVGGVERLVIVEPAYYNGTEQLVKGVKIGTSSSDQTEWLVDFPSGQRLMVSQEKVKNGDLI